MGNWVGPIISGIVLALVSWVLKSVDVKQVGEMFNNFLTTFWPVLVGFIGFGVYWLIRDYVRLRKWVYDRAYDDTNKYESLDYKIRFISQKK